MANNRRKNLRLPHYDYSQTGAYFITIVTQERISLFGSIMDCKMMLNKAGEMVNQVCKELPQIFTFVQLEPYIIMPNHIHAIFVLGSGSVGADLRVSPKDLDERQTHPAEGIRQFTPTHNYDNEKSLISIPNLVKRFKTLTTRRYIDGVKKNNWPRFDKHLWQRNYYEHVIRDEIDYELIADFIFSNPQNWEKDPEKIQIIR